MELDPSRCIKESGSDHIPPKWDPARPARGTGSSSGTGCGFASGRSNGIWQSGRWTHRKCYNDWTASRAGAPNSRNPIWLPRVSSIGRRWWAHGKSWVRPTPRIAHQCAWCRLGDQQPDGHMPATYGDLPSLGAPSQRPTCRYWVKRSSSPCLLRARKPEQPRVVFQDSRRWPLRAGSHNYGGTGCGAYQIISGFPGRPPICST